jgi:hypothetical protein
MTMAINEGQARLLAEALLAAGREPMWVLLLVSAYHGPAGRAVALEVIEEITKFPPQLCDYPGQNPSGLQKE